MEYNSIGRGNGKKNVILEFCRADGQSLTAGTDFPDYKIYKAEGLTGLPYNFTTSTSPQIPGASIDNRRAEARNINVELDCDHELREHALSFFNPMYVMRLICEWNGVKRWIAGYVKPVKVIGKNIYDKITLGIELYCPDPYWNDMSNYGKDITFRKALMAFPFVMLRDRGLIASYRVAGNTITVANTGDVAVPIRVVFRAHGDITNPRISLTDARNRTQFIQINTPMSRGDTLDISTDPREIYVRLNGQSVLNRSDRLSTFFQLPVGASLFSYEAGQEFDSVSVVVYFTPQFLGV